MLYMIPAKFDSKQCDHRDKGKCKLVRKLKKVGPGDYEKDHQVLMQCPAFNRLIEKVAPIIGEAQGKCIIQDLDTRLSVTYALKNLRNDVHLKVTGPSPYNPDPNKFYCEIDFDYIGIEDHRDDVLKAYDKAGFTPYNRNVRLQ